MCFFKSLSLVIITCFFFITSLVSQAHTTLLVFMQASHGLNEYAIKNIHDMVAHYVGDHTHIVVQWHADGNTAWRFHITHQSLVSDGIVVVNDNTCQALVESVTWAHATFPSKYFALILWGHGYGILDPLWNGNNQGWQSKQPQKEYNRPLLSHTYMSNTMIFSALKEITNNILHKKIDYLGTDACSMSMFEVLYQCKDYVHFFSGAEDCELPDGYHYAALAQTLSSYPLEPQNLAIKIVQDFDEYYRLKTGNGHYTQAATDLTHITRLKENLDAIVATYHAYKKQDASIRLIIGKARAATIQFFINKNYVDIAHFYQNVQEKLARHKPNKQAEKNHAYLNLLLAQGLHLIEQAVIASAIGKASKNAHGIAIYFPLTTINQSYRSTLFAQTSRWISLLEDMVSL